MARLSWSAALLVTILAPQVVLVAGNVEVEVTADGQVISSESGRVLLQKTKNGRSSIKVAEEEEEYEKEEKAAASVGGESSLEHDVHGITAGNATGEKWMKCVSSAFVLIPEIVMLGKNFGKIAEQCNEGPDTCRKSIEGVISQINSLVYKITNDTGIVAACSGEGNACAAILTGPGGPVEKLQSLQSGASAAVEECTASPENEVLDCALLQIQTLLPMVPGFVQSIIDAIHECKRGCKKVEVLNGCNARCEQGGGNWRCSSRVRYLYGTKSFTLNAALERVNKDCCHACVCSQADFTDLEDCDKPCDYSGATFSCASRTTWVFENDEKVMGDKQASIDLINHQCEKQCSCNINSNALAHL